jgi:hypothetical protein
MSKKFSPSTRINKKKELDAFVNEAPSQAENEEEKAIQRKQHGYLIRPDYIKNISYLSVSLDKKKWEILEEALTDYFEKHKTTLEIFNR